MAGGFFTTEPPGKPHLGGYLIIIILTIILLFQETQCADTCSQISSGITIRKIINLHLNFPLSSLCNLGEVVLMKACSFLFVQKNTRDSVSEISSSHLPSVELKAVEMLTAGNAATKQSLSTNFSSGKILNTHKGTEYSCVRFQKPSVVYRISFISTPTLFCQSILKEVTEILSFHP